MVVVGLQRGRHTREIDWSAAAAAAAAVPKQPVAITDVYTQPYGPSSPFHRGCAWFFPECGVACYWVSSDVPWRVAQG